RIVGRASCACLVHDAGRLAARRRGSGGGADLRGHSVHDVAAPPRPADWRRNRRGARPRIRHLLPRSLAALNRTRGDAVPTNNRRVTGTSHHGGTLSKSNEDTETKPQKP